MKIGDRVKVLATEETPEEIGELVDIGMNGDYFAVKTDDGRIVECSCEYIEEI